jgi:hypothetical protein
MAMNPIVAGASIVVAIGTIGGGTMTLNKMHVASEDFKEYIEQQLAADEREYVRDLKGDIRDVRAALLVHVDDEYLIEELADLIDELCEVRIEDRLCEVDDNSQ